MRATKVDRVAKNGPKSGDRGADLLPELIIWRDDGCDIHPACLTCPLPRCKYEEPDGGRLMAKRLRNQELVQVWRESRLEVEDLAQRFNLSKRSVQRILKRQEEFANGYN